MDLLRRSLRPGGTMLIGEPYWRREPLDQATVEGCHATSADDFRVLPELLEQFGELGCDVVEMVLADQDSWDRYVAAQWLTTRRSLRSGIRVQSAGKPGSRHRESLSVLGRDSAMASVQQRAGVFVLLSRSSRGDHCWFVAVVTKFRATSRSFRFCSCDALTSSL